MYKDKHRIFKHCKNEHTYVYMYKVLYISAMLFYNVTCNTFWLLVQCSIFTQKILSPSA